MPRRSRDRLLAAGIALTVLVVFLLAVFTRVPLGPWTFRPGVASLALLFTLVALAARRGLLPLGRPDLFVFGCGLLVFHLFQHHGGRLTNDGVINFVYLRSAVIDRDLDFTNEFEDFVPQKFQIIAEISSAAGRAPDPSNEPGPALLWAPFYVAAHLLVELSRALGSEVPDDGYSHPYVNAVSVAGVFYAFLAVAVAYRIAARFYSAWLSAVAVSGLWFASTLYWYTVFEPTMPHATTAAVASTFIWAWLRVREDPTTLRWVLVALLGGLLLSMQRYAVFFFTAPALTLGAIALSRIRARHAGWPEPRAVILAGAALLLAALPMLAYNFLHSEGSTIVRVGDIGVALRNWADPKVAELLFSTQHGLFAWTPAAYVAVMGLVIFIGKERRLALALLATLASGVYLLGATWDWHAGSSYGARRLTEAFAIFALGFTAAADYVARRPRAVAIGALAVLVTGNVVLSELVQRGTVPMRGTVDFSAVASPAAELLYEQTGHPASFPAPLLFARRYGVSPAQFDHIFGHRSYNDLAIDVGADDAPFLGRGWSGAEVTGDGTRFRWSSAESSTWLVSLFDPYPYRLRLLGAASRHPDGPSRTLPVAIFVNGHSVGSLVFTPEVRSLERLVEREFWHRGLNEIELRYGWTVEAGEAYGSNDTREIALRLLRFELEIVR